MFGRRGPVLTPEWRKFDIFQKIQQFFDILNLACFLPIKTQVEIAQFSQGNIFNKKCCDFFQIFPRGVSFNLKINTFLAYFNKEVQEKHKNIKTQFFLHFEHLNMFFTHQNPGGDCSAQLGEHFEQNILQIFSKFGRCFNLKIYTFLAFFNNLSSFLTF